MSVHRDSELRDAEQRWLNGGSALPVVTLLLSREAKVQAAAVARLAVQLLFVLSLAARPFSRRMLPAIIRYSNSRHSSAPL